MNSTMLVFYKTAKIIRIGSVIITVPNGNGITNLPFKNALRDSE